MPHVPPLSCTFPVPREVRVRVAVVIVVIVATICLVRHGYDAGSAVAVISLAGGAAFDLARRLLAPAPVAAVRRVAGK
ncbi:hypothetical protein AB0I10_31730 [Streptomyces sp. NPDC050636]|uniref:hypothetical protein n=1 Tax=Streptomyces sp. NPDC050636 TaxID=3154510 RepID=UPI003417E718